MASNVSLQIADNATFTFKWKFEKYSHCIHALRSPAFIVDTRERSKWHLEMYPKMKIKSGTHIGLYLLRAEDSKGPPNIKVAFELSLLDSDGSILNSKYSHGVEFLKNSKSGFNCVVERKCVFAQRSKYMPRGTLTVQCRMWIIGNNSTHGHCIARSHFGVERQTFHWKIENFSLFHKHQESLLTLKSASDDQKILTVVFSYGKEPTTDDLFLFFRNQNQSLFSTFKVSVLTTQGDLLDCGTSEIYQRYEFRPRCKIPLSKSRLIRDKYMYLPNNVLTLYCEFAYATGINYHGIEETSDECIGSSTTSDMATAKIKCSNYPDLKMDISAMLRNSTLCDVKLCVEGQTFQAHWFVLIARSPVFRAMHKSDMKEKIKSQIHISDLRPETVGHMLHYLYTDECEELNWETASELLVAAHKYLILGLRDKCSSFLRNNLDCENACEVLLLSESLQDKELKAAAKKFIMQNDKVIFKSSEWKLVMEADVNLAFETMLLRYEE